MARNQRRRALVEFVEEEQRREWERLLNGTRRAITSPLSIEVEGTLERLRESIALVGPSDWDSVPWAVYLSGLYERVIGPEHAACLPRREEFTQTVAMMAPHTNHLDVERCHELVDILRTKEQEA